MVSRLQPSRAVAARSSSSSRAWSAPVSSTVRLATALTRDGPPPSAEGMGPMLA